MAGHSRQRRRRFARLWPGHPWNLSTLHSLTDSRVKPAGDGDCVVRLPVW